MTHAKTRHRSAIYAWPALLGALTAFALLAALCGDAAVWRWLAWVALAAPLAVVAGCSCIGLRRARRGLHTETSNTAP